MATDNDGSDDISGNRFDRGRSVYGGNEIFRAWQKLAGGNAGAGSGDADAGSDRRMERIRDGLVSL